MPDDLTPLNIAPGLYTQNTDRGAKGRWKNGSWVRWVDGLAEKIGGYNKRGTNTFLGKCRGVIDWTSLALLKYAGFGTHLKLYVQLGGAFSDITPIRSSVTIDNDPITTTDTSTSVSILDTAHGASAGDYVTFAGATAVGGITISGEYAIQTITDADNYVITHSAAATSSANGGGASVTAAYQISVGKANSIVGRGFGAGPFGDSTWGTARTVTSLLSMARIWSLDNWGEDLIACPRDGAIYVWDTSVGTGTRATVISGAPASAKAVFVSDENRHMVALGAHDGSAADPMLVRWSTSEDYTDWTPSAVNTAGDKRLDGGNELYCRVAIRRGDVIFTDATAWLMTFDGPPYTFGWKSLGTNGGIRGPNAATEYDGRVFWMGQKEFYVYDGYVRVLKCDVLDHVMDDISSEQSALVFAGSNASFGEVWWLYPSDGATECDSFVLYNVADQTWSYGTLARTAYVGNSKVFDGPYAFGADGYLYDHEVGVDADGAAITSYLESGDLEIGDGSYLAHIKKLVPDFKRLAGTMTVLLTGKKYPGSTDTQTKTVTMNSTTEYANLRLRARQISLKLTVSDAGADYRMGTLRAVVRPHGKR